MITVASLHIYPVKACAGISLSRARVTRRGLANDRRWMIVDERGEFLTQRTHPHLCLVKTRIDGDVLALEYQGARIEVPRAPEDGAACAIKVWSYEGRAIEQVSARGWISDVVGAPSRLVYMPDDVERPVNADYGRAGDVVSFADGFPVLLATSASLAELNRRMDAPLPMTRFRPNVVVDGGEPFAEDRWTRVAMNDASFRVAKGCDRCVVTTVDPETGARGKEPLRTLATFRKWDDQVWFAMNLIPDELGTIEVGAPLTIAC